MPDSLGISRADLAHQLSQINLALENSEIDNVFYKTRLASYGLLKRLKNTFYLQISQALK